MEIPNKDAIDRHIQRAGRNGAAFIYSPHHPGFVAEFVSPDATEELVDALQHALEERMGADVGHMVLDSDQDLMAGPSGTSMTYLEIAGPGDLSLYALVPQKGSTHAMNHLQAARDLLQWASGPWGESSTGGDPRFGVPALVELVVEPDEPN